MTSQQLADRLLAKWQQLWVLPPTERLRLIDQIADEAFEQELQLVANEMGAAA